MPTEPEVFALADHALNDVVQQIGDDQWQLAIPEWIKLGRVSRDGLTLRALLNYHAYDDAWVPAMVAGQTMDDVGDGKWKDEDLLGEDPKKNFAAIVETAVSAALAVTPGQLMQTAHLSFGDFSVQEYFWQISQFRAFRAYEFGVLIGVDPTLPEDLVAGLWEQLQPNVEHWRAIGVYGPAVPLPADAPLHDKLLGITGREPRH
jgi:hypothetical protein